MMGDGQARQPSARSARLSSMDRTVAWRTLGTLLIIAAGVIIAFAYMTRPSAESCAFVDRVSGAGACSPGPGVAVFIVSGALALAGALILVNARRR